MAKTVGMNRAVKREWLDKTAGLVNAGHDETKIRAELQEYLSFEIKSPVVLKNTRTILLQSWVYIEEDQFPIRDAALRVIGKEIPADIIAAHWCMMLIAYPLMRDICNLIGKLTNIQDTFSVAWIKEKLTETWGERATILDSVSKILQTMRQLGVIENANMGTYKINKFMIHSEEAIVLLVQTILYMKEKAYYEISDVQQVPSMFPFEFTVTHELIYNTESLKLSNFGGKAVLTSE